MPFCLDLSVMCHVISVTTALCTCVLLIRPAITPLAVTRVFARKGGPVQPIQTWMVHRVKVQLLRSLNSIVFDIEAFVCLFFVLKCQSRLKHYVDNWRRIAKKRGTYIKCYVEQQVATKGMLLHVYDIIWCNSSLLMLFAFDIFNRMYAVQNLLQRRIYVLYSYVDLQI